MMFMRPIIGDEVVIDDCGDITSAIVDDVDFGDFTIRTDCFEWYDFDCITIINGEHVDHPEEGEPVVFDVSRASIEDISTLYEAHLEKAYQEGFDAKDGDTVLLVEYSCMCSNSTVLCKNKEYEIPNVFLWKMEDGGFKAVKCDKNQLLKRR